MKSGVQKVQTPLGSTKLGPKEMALVEKVRDILNLVIVEERAWSFLVDLGNPSRGNLILAVAQYPETLRIAEYALKTAFIIHLASLFDEDKRSFTLLRVPGVTSIKDYDKLSGDGKKLFKFRNKFVAHVDEQEATSNPLGNLPFTFGELQHLIQQASRVFNEAMDKLGLPGTSETDITLELHRLLDRKGSQ